VLRADEVLGRSEPIRNRSQGTLFALDDDEAEQILSLIACNDPAAGAQGGEQLELQAGWLTSVTFHPSYTYEDFIEGYKPTEDADSTGLTLELRDGVFANICSAAAADPRIPHLLLIDEINRGNLPKIFGELLTILERDKRGVDVTLAQSGAAFSVPDNVYIIGTMNTADRSIRLLDAALRRRFAFIEMLPRPDLLEGASVGPLALDEFLEELNDRIRSKYGREKQIGHSYFLEGGQPIVEPEVFARVMRDEVMPLLQEYAYDHYGDLKELLGAGVVDAENETLQIDVILDAEAFVAALYEDFQANTGQSA
jgi:5-methylcytosine-specific restriction enzyme B